MTPFLKSVAALYLDREREAMMDYCFVFPNKRSGVFFRKYLLELSAGSPLILPAFSSIGELIGELSTLAEASRLDQLFTLYSEYAPLSGEMIDFDRFMFWGEMILSDFNDVDRDLVDPDKLFVNLKRYREVNADYLTEEQKDILSRYWGGEFETHRPGEFWTHLHADSPTLPEQRFLKLWEVLAELYHRFTTALRRRGNGTQGMMAREAVERLRTIPSSALRYKRYIFVGFNVLSLSELRIFGNLMRRGVADFYWDTVSPIFDTGGNRAARFMRRNILNFPSLYDLPAEDAVTPSVSVTGVPSGIGQAKKAGEILDRWIDEGVVTDPSDAISTAVVLPDEGLFIPMIHSVPTRYTSLNVTMGLPLRYTSFASFISSVVTLHLRSHRTDEGVSTFFHDDVKTLISHPLLRRIDTEGCDSLMRLITERRLFMVPVTAAAEAAPGLSFVLTPVDDPDNPEAVYSYFHTMLTTLRDTLAPLTDSGDEETPQRVVYDVEAFYIQTYLDALEELMGAIRRHSVSMRDSTFIQLLQRAVSGVSANLEGEPLAGLQVMGVLETRALDFDNIIILSMNERVFPRKHYTRSFIPDTLRRAYGMATADHQESIYAYYFYRLISRASNVALIYDARSSGGRSNEMSRYIAQMLYLFPGIRITHTLDSFEIGMPAESAITIEKTDDIMQRIDSFRTPGGRTLSASSINDYINCPLSFYLKRICGLNLDEEVIDYMDAATYGSILHEVAERIYKNLRGDRPEVRITAEMLEHVINDRVGTDRLITQVVNQRFNRLPEGDLTPLSGEAKVLGKVMRHFIVMMMRQEMKFTPFDFIDGEHRIEGPFTLDNGLTINISQIIDRIDRVYPPGHYGDPTAGYIRIVDYKTGHDKTSFSGFDQLFDNSQTDRRKAILQLFFYCNAYARATRYEGQIQPMIYSMASISTKGLTSLTYDRKEFTDYRTVNEEFMQRFTDAVSEIFDPAVPFTQAPSDHNCTFCSFKDICRRNTK